MKDTLKKEVINLINQGIEYFEAGGAIGFDTLATQTIIDLRKEYEQIKLILIIPCRDQACGWSYEDQIVYMDVKRKADKIIYLSEKYKRGCMFKRNRYMVNNSKFVVASWDGRKYGGTYYTINYAKKLNRKIIFLNF